MTIRATIDDFLAQPTLAIVGVSRQGGKFGNMALKELRAKEYQVFAVNPQAETLEGQPCYASLEALPDPVGGLLIVVPPEETEKVVRQAAAAGIQRVWMQQGAESEEAIHFCQEQGISTVHGECIMMFAEPTGLGHKMHRWVWGLLGKLPD
jgi:predicted CoA-binding protein